MISLAQVGNSADYTYINVGKYRTTGFDLSVSHSINHWKLSVGMVYTGRSNIEDDSVKNSRMFYSPEYRAAITYEFKKLGANLAFYYKYIVQDVYTKSNKLFATQRELKALEVRH